MTEISLVVCTRNRAEKLRSTLRRVARIQTGRAWEMVIVDNGSTDGTAEVIDRFAGTATFPVRHEREPVPGLNRARNRGCEAAVGDLIALMDDDCYPRPDHLDAVTEIFLHHDVGWAGGRMTQHDPNDAPVGIVDRDHAELLPAHNFPQPGLIGGGNLAFRRSLFRDVRGFDETLGVGTSLPCGDIEFCARASDRGWDGGYFPGPTVRHHHGRRPGREARTLERSYGRGRGAYYAKTLLEFPTLRSACLRHVYWQRRDQGLAGAYHEVEGALRYATRRLTRRGARKGARTEGVR